MNIFNLPVRDYLHLRLQSVNHQLAHHSDPEIMLVTLSVLEGLWMDEYWQQRLQQSDPSNAETNYAQIWPEDSESTLSPAALEMLQNNSIRMSVF